MDGNVKKEQNVTQQNITEDCKSVKDSLYYTEERALDMRSERSEKALQASLHFHTVCKGGKISHFPLEEREHLMFLSR